MVSLYKEYVMNHFANSLKFSWSFDILSLYKEYVMNHFANSLNSLIIKLILQHNRFKTFKML